MTKLMISADVSADDLAVIERGLVTYSERVSGVEQMPVCFALKDTENVCLGGIRANTADKDLHIRWLWVAEELRCGGYGRMLMEKAERTGRELGCVAAWVDTATFQAPGFYEKLGYQKHTIIPGFYAGHDRIFFRKML